MGLFRVHGVGNAEVFADTILVLISIWAKPLLVLTYGTDAGRINPIRRNFSIF
jgi:hypothetical protein